MDLQSKRDLNNGFGDAMARAVELVLTPAIFGFLGHLLDNKLGTSPLFMLSLIVIVFSYMVWKFWGDYDRRMTDHETKLGFNARKQGARHG